MIENAYLLWKKLIYFPSVSFGQELLNCSLMKWSCASSVKRLSYVSNIHCSLCVSETWSNNGREVKVKDSNHIIKQLYT